MIQPNIPGIKTTNTDGILNRHTKLAQLIWAPSGFGKTKLAGTLDALTQKYEDKRTLYIAVESAEGGGAATIKGLGIPLMLPRDYNEIDKAVSYLRNDKSVGGVVLDSATELVKQHLKPVVLKYPCRENPATRAAGVFTQSDYQVAGDLLSPFLRKLMLLTTHENPEYRKHLVITAADQTKTDRESERVIWQGPDLPGRMSRETVQMFQVVSTIEIKPQVIDGKRVSLRYLVSNTDGLLSVKDRFEVLPTTPILLRKDPSQPGDDLCTLWEKFWLPAIEAAEARKAKPNGTSSGDAKA